MRFNRVSFLFQLREKLFSFSMNKQELPKQQITAAVQMLKKITYRENNYRYSEGYSHKYSKTHNKKENISTQISRVGVKQFWFDFSYKENSILVRFS